MLLVVLCIPQAFPGTLQLRSVNVLSVYLVSRSCEALSASITQQGVCAGAGREVMLFNKGSMTSISIGSIGAV